MEVVGTNSRPSSPPEAASELDMVVDATPTRVEGQTTVLIRSLLSLVILCEIGLG